MATDAITDMKLTADSNGIYDIGITSAGDIETENSFDTALLMSLLTDKRADESEVQQSNARRGWIGNLFNSVVDYEIGSKLWLLHQARNTQLNLNKAIGFAYDSFNWIIQDGYADDRQVTGALTASGIRIDTTILRKNDATERFYVLWQNSIYI